MPPHDAGMGSASSAARPVTCSDGAPESARSTQTSWKPNEPRPRPERLHDRLAGGEPCSQRRDRIGLRRDVGRARSSVNNRSRIVGVRVNDVRNRSMSTTSTPIPIIAGSSDVMSFPDAPGQVRQRSAVSEIGAMSKIVDGELAQLRDSSKLVLGLRHPVDQTCIAVVVPLEHRPHHVGREPLVQTHVQQGDAGADAGLHLGHEDDRALISASLGRRAAHRCRRRRSAWSRRGGCRRRHGCGRSREIPDAIERSRSRRRRSRYRV